MQLQTQQTILYMKHLPYILLSSALIMIGCQGGNIHAEFHRDTIENCSFNYLDDTYVTDSDIFTLASKLDRVVSIYYSDSPDKIADYKAWYADIDAYVQTRLKQRNLDVKTCFDYITDSIIEDIRIYGHNCTACEAEYSWLNYGMTLYQMFDKSKDNSDNMENDLWLKFMSNYLPLIEYEIYDMTGSSAAFEIPLAFNKVAKARLTNISDNSMSKDMTNRDVQNSVIRLKTMIDDINTFHLNFENGKLEEDSIYSNYKNYAIKALDNWIEISDTLKVTPLLDSLTNTLYNIRH